MVNIGIPLSRVGRAAALSFADEARARPAASTADRIASTVVTAVSAVLPVVGAIDLAFTIKDIVEDKESTAARCLREKADQLEWAFSEMS